MHVGCGQWMMPYILIWQNWIRYWRASTWCSNDRIKKLHMRTNFLCIYHWASDTLTDKARVHTKAASEMLIMRLSTIKKLADEYELSIDVTLLTGWPGSPKMVWLHKKGWRASMEDPDEITKIHHLSRHPGVQRTCYFVGLTNLSVSTRAVVKECQAYQSIDPTPVKWQKRKLRVSSTWSRLAMDITHYSSQHFLTLIDCKLAAITAVGLYKCHLPISQYFTNEGCQRRSLLTTILLSAADNLSVSWTNWRSSLDCDVPSEVSSKY